MLHFEDAPASFRWVTTDCFALTPFFTKICPGYVGYGRDRGILQSLGVPRIYILNWRPPDFGRYKVNIDGLSKGNPGLSACEGVFRDNIGTFLGSFGISPSVNTACFAEAIILAVELADCWWKLWPKAESILVIHLSLITLSVKNCESTQFVNILITGYKDLYIQIDWN